MWAFPKSFGIEEEKKGFFPHFFNVPNHQQYVGPLPANDYYDPDIVKAARKAEFDRWYIEEKEWSWLRVWFSKGTVGLLPIRHQVITERPLGLLSRIRRGGWVQPFRNQDAQVEMEEYDCVVPMDVDSDLPTT